VLGSHYPVLAVDEQGRAQFSSAGLDHLACGVRLGSDDTGDTGLQDAGLLEGDLGQGLAQILLMVDRDRGDHRQRRAVDHVGGVQAAAEADLQQGVIRLGAGEGHIGGDGGDFEKGDRLVAVDPLAFLQQRGQRGFADQLSGNADALVEAGQVGRCIGMDGLAFGLHPGADHRQGRTLAVGPGDMHHRRQTALWLAHRRQQPPDPVQGQVDDLRVEREQPVEDRIA
jgi:hypothetical protein